MGTPAAVVVPVITSQRVAQDAYDRIGKQLARVAASETGQLAPLGNVSYCRQCQSTAERSMNDDDVDASLAMGTYPMHYRFSARSRQSSFYITQPT